MSNSFSYGDKIEFLRDLGCHKVGHSSGWLRQGDTRNKDPESRAPNGTLLDHLIRVYKTLESWEAPQYVRDAGLFHSVYGTVYFKSQVTSDRDSIINIIGHRAEVLAYIYCMLSDPRGEALMRIEDEQVKKDLLLIDKANDEDNSLGSMMSWEEAYRMKGDKNE